MVLVVLMAISIFMAFANIFNDDDEDMNFD